MNGFLGNFIKTPKNYWLNIENQRKYFDWLSNKLNIKSMEDWYNIRIEEVDSIYGATLINTHYNGLLYSALKLIYPNYEWIPWKFQIFPNNYLSNIE